jgi:hypothetical protein
MLSNTTIPKLRFSGNPLSQGKTDETNPKSKKGTGSQFEPRVPFAKEGFLPDPISRTKFVGRIPRRDFVTNPIPQNRFCDEFHSPK